MTPQGLKLIKDFEGLSLEAYPDPGSGGEPFTIGYGSTSNVHPGMTITEAEAEARLLEDVKTAQDAINRFVLVPLSPAQKDALTSFVFNVGAGAFQSSTLLRKLNARDYKGAADQLLRWDKAGGRVLAGLSRRRRAERELFLSDIPPEPMVPFIAAALPALAKAIPDLWATISDRTKDSSDQYAKVGERLATIAVEAVGASNVQDAAEKISRDPEAARAFQEAAKASMWELVEVGPGIAGARTFAAEYAAKPRNVPLEVVTYALLGVFAVAVVMVLGNAMWRSLLTGDHVSMIVQATIGASLMVGGFWLGSSYTTSKSRGIAEK